MPSQPNFSVDEKACIIQNAYVVPEVRGACGVIREVHPGTGFGGQRQQPLSWSTPHVYLVDLGPKGALTTPEGLLQPDLN